MAIKLLDSTHIRMRLRNRECMPGTAARGKAVAKATPACDAPSCRLLGLLALCAVLCGCSQDKAAGNFSMTGTIKSAMLDEISGIQPGTGAEWYVHNDDGDPEIHVIDLKGHHLATISVNGAKNRDWEDLASIPGSGGPVLVIGDIGDNEGIRKSIRLYLVPLPTAKSAPGDASARYPGRLELLHKVILRYPDGPRDCESMAYDAASGQILLMTKRDVPPRLYGLSAQSALDEDEVTLAFLGTVRGLRPPTPQDLLLDPQRGAWVSEPTSMDISANGRLAAVLTYRSLYLYQRNEEESWPQAFRSAPLEIPGPPGTYDEAVAFSKDQGSIVVTTERLPAPLYRLDLSRLDINHLSNRP